MTEIEKYLEEGRSYIESEDVVQASEKLYKGAEEAVKALSELYASDVSNEARARDRWTTELLFKAVMGISDKLDSGVKHSWNAAWTLHVQGFHEGRLDIAYVASQLEDIEKLVKLATSQNQQRRKNK
jgi:hypothetical protein